MNFNDLTNLERLYLDRNEVKYYLALKIKKNARLLETYFYQKYEIVSRIRSPEKFSSHFIILKYFQEISKIFLNTGMARKLPGGRIRLTISYFLIKNGFQKIEHLFFFPEKIPV